MSINKATQLGLRQNLSCGDKAESLANKKQTKRWQEVKSKETETTIWRKQKRSEDYLYCGLIAEQLQQDMGVAGGKGVKVNKGRVCYVRPARAWPGRGGRKKHVINFHPKLGNILVAVMQGCKITKNSIEEDNIFIKQTYSAAQYFWIHVLSTDLTMSAVDGWRSITCS